MSTENNVVDLDTGVAAEASFDPNQRMRAAITMGRALAESTVNFGDRWGNHDEPWTPEAMKKRVAMLREEVDELEEAVASGRKFDMIDEAVDCAYVAMGTLTMLGYDAVWSALYICQKNEAKDETTHTLDKKRGKLVRKEQS